MLLGRSAERARLDDLLGRCRLGTGGAMVLDGEAGIGKTALLDYAAGIATGMRVLRGRGIESESCLPFHGLWDLLQPVLDRLPTIPSAQAAALEQAFALAAAEGHDRFSAFVAVHSLLTSASEVEPIVVICDDVHWIDVVSAEALLFTARRIAQDPIAILFGARTGEHPHLDFVGVPTLTVSGLDRRTSADLLAACAGRTLAPKTEDRLIRAAAGNPLAMTEAVAMLSPAQLSGEQELPDPLPAGQTIASGLARILGGQPASARQALAVAAASDTGELRPILSALTVLGLGADDLQVMEGKRVISIGNERLEFRHPLLRAAAYDLASADERRSAHRALAGAMTGRADSASRAWHLAAAAIGPDELAAQALEAAALDAQARGDLNSAAAAFDKASSLSAAREMRVRRSMSAATALSMVGRVPEAIHLLDRAAGETADPVQLAAIRSLRGVAGTWSGRPREAHDNLVAEALEVMNVDPASAASMLTIATINRYTTGDIKEALKTARLSRTALRKSGGRNLVRGELFYLSALLLSGKGTSVKRGLMKIAGSMNEIDIADSALDIGMLGLDLIWLEEYELARQKLEHLLSRAREAGAIGVLVYPMTVVSELEFRTGNWPSSFVAATEAVTLGTEFKQVNALTYALVTLARIEAAMGQDAESRLHSEAASSLAAELDTGSIITYASSVEGFRALGNNRPEEAVAHLAMLPDYVVGNGMGNPNAVQWRPDLIEAAVLCGRQDLARQQLEIFEAERDRTGSQWAAITSARCRGLLADDDGFEGHFLRALDGHPAFAAP
ncbi:MAG TPA: AAA family ATPase, partial [Candidatus Dormibacteraeota bacterium]